MRVWIVLGVVALVIVLVVGAYNRLVELRNRYKNAFSQIDVQLKRRYDLIPNLVETAKGYMKHEHDTLEAVIKARNIALAASQTAAANPADPNAMKGLVSAEGGLAYFTPVGDRPGFPLAVARTLAELRMNRIAQTAGPKVDFELYCLGVSAINGCELCLRAHEKAVLEGGLGEEQVHDAVRIAATVQAAAVALEIGDIAARSTAQRTAAAEAGAAAAEASAAAAEAGAAAGANAGAG